MNGIPPFLSKLLSKAALAKAIELIKQQPTAATPEDGTANHATVAAGVLAFVEALDDKVELIPFAGPILKALVDSPEVDRLEKLLVDYVVEQAYQVLKLGGTK
ncbi:hypothetical protein [Deinococcus sp. Leaf326]|uniref:hypothetical protein n=1 Tax=Deinococcus sp. Leaf326 TaxID=1736338 RepID=UPI0006FA4075|nr:hypothetical protein [Deinococcus sp. Leaf326]KQR22855.1 hypothetical protein ASF71_06730 [Deinococcus sp. Leaf326]